nr:hypothetical protein [Tanacetum cinerariifolium]
MRVATLESQGGMRFKDNDLKIKIQAHRRANDESKEFPRTQGSKFKEGAPRGQDNKSRDVTRRTMLVETPNSSALVSCDGLRGYDWSDQVEEGPTNYTLLAYSTSSASSLDYKVSDCSKTCLKAIKNLKDRALTELQRKLDLAETKKEGIQLNVNKLENASKSLNKILECQIVDNCKKGPGYNAVLPPHTCLFRPPKSDLSYTGLEELFNEPKTKKSKDKSNDVEPESVRKGSDVPIIEDWCQIMKRKSYANKKVKTIWVKKVNTNKPKAAVNAAKAKAKHKAVKGKRGNAVKALACWGNPHEHLQDKGVIDNGCSRHKTGNMSFLTDYEEINGGYVAFEGNPKGGKITDVKKASTPTETLKPFLKDEDGEEVDIHIYRSMIGSLMYLTSSMPAIMFVACACARYQVILKVSHLHRKHKPRRKQRMETKVSPTETNTEEHIPTPSNDPRNSGKDRMQLKELMELCTNLSNKVLELESKVIEMKSSHKAKIEELESRESSKHERKIADIDADAEVNLDNVYNLDMAHKETVLSMQDVDVQSERIKDVVKDVVATAKNIKAKSKAKRVTIKEPNEFKTTLPSQSSLPSQAKDKGKGLMVEPKMPLTRKDQIALDEEVARGLEAEWNADIKDNIDWNELEEQEESEELKKNLEIVPDDEDDVFVNVTLLSSKPPTIMDYKIYKEGKKEHFQIFRANISAVSAKSYCCQFKLMLLEEGLLLLEDLMLLIQETSKEIKITAILESFSMTTSCTFRLLISPSRASDDKSFDYSITVTFTLHLGCRALRNFLT